MLAFDLTDGLKLRMRKLAHKDRPLLEILRKKMREIVSNDAKTASSRYKNLRQDLQGLKRVHVDRHFVLTFRVGEAKSFVLFMDFDHHDKVYR